jgi:hypothetical protein
MADAIHPFAGARKMKPTLKHRAAIWECMLGTVYASSPQGEIKYFDYDWDAARTFAGADQEGTDPRVWKAAGRGGSEGEGYRKGQPVLWLLRTP